MKKNFTHMVFVLDRSGSMGGLEKGTIGGFNSLAEKQRALAGEAVVTTVLFDDRYELLHNALNVKKLPPMTEKDYFVRGSTALLDAVGRTIEDVGNKLAKTSESERPDKVMFVIITDGFENASRIYNADKVRQMIEHQKSKYSWEFMFLGANIDAVQVAKDYGIEEEMAVEFCSDSIGTDLNYAAVSEAIQQVRSGAKLSRKWKECIEEDMMTRVNNKTE